MNFKSIIQITIIIPDYLTIGQIWALWIPDKSIIQIFTVLVFPTNSITSLNWRQQDQCRAKHFRPIFWVVVHGEVDSWPQYQRQCLTGGQNRNGLFGMIAVDENIFSSSLFQILFGIVIFCWLSTVLCKISLTIVQV